MPFPSLLDHELPPSELDRLRVAFAVQVAREIAEADGILDASEIMVLGRAFPNDWMHRCGFLDEDGAPNEALERWHVRACAELPTRLTLGQKLEMVTLFHEMAVADEELHGRELAIVTDVARLLRVSRDAFRRHLATLDTQWNDAPPVQE